MLIVATLIAVAAVIFLIPEIGLVLCMVVGALLKGMVQPYVEVVDVTLYLVAVTYFTVFVRSSADRTLALPDARINILVGLFLSLLFVSLLWTPVEAAGLYKLARVAFLTVSMMYATVMWCTSVDRVRRVLFLFTCVALTYAAVTFIIVFFVDNQLSSDMRANIRGACAIGVGQLLAMAILAAVAVRQLVAGRATRIVIDALAVVSVVELVALNSRGPLIALLVGVGCLVLLSWVDRGRRVLGISMALLTIVAVAFAVLPSRYTGRYQLLTDLGSTSVSARVEMWSIVAAHGADWFLTGAGTSGFGVAYLGDADLGAAMRLYPHNIFLDVFVNGGFFALLVFGCLIGLLLYRGFLLCRAAEGTVRSAGIAATVLFVAFLVASLFSGNLLDTRPLWLFAGLVVSLQLVARRIERVGR